MYERHFDLERLPFEAPASSADLFVSREMRETETRLGQLLRARGIGLLTGEPGSGKTSACRRFADSLHPGRHRVCYVSLSTGTVLDIYQSIGWEPGLEPQRRRAAARRAIRDEITRLARESGRLPVLVVDEAQHLRNDVLEELRLLTNFAMDSERRPCLLLAGLGELQRRLRMAAHQSLAQRVTVRQHLAGLQRDELQPYLAHSLRLAGCERELFAPEACEALFEAARGLPRQVSRVAHRSLLAAALDRASRVGPEHVERGAEEARP